jgi:hypothetical protein
MRLPPTAADLLCFWCPAANTCRDAKAEKQLACLQQQQLILNNPGYVDDFSAAVAGKRSTRVPTPWDTLRQECRPILQQISEDMQHTETQDNPAQPPLVDKVLLGNRRHLLQGTMPIMQLPGLNSSDAIAGAYASMLCAEGYQGRLCR